MFTPKPGAYRQEAVLAALNPNITSLFRNGLKLALTNVPIVGCVLRKDLSASIAQAFADLGTELGNYYAEHLRSGAIVPIVPQEAPDYYWAPGELYFKS